jgi:CheY-like chemotaxis protein
VRLGENIKEEFMPKRILVADDSLTIQKVVGITLSDTDYELYQALTDEELMNSLESENFDLILLDFNLSENHAGQDLIKNIRNQNENIPILIMLGTFDNVDENILINIVNVNKIVKPFESTKFLSLCNELIHSKNLSVAADEENIKFEAPPNNESSNLEEEVAVDFDEEDAVPFEFKEEDSKVDEDIDFETESTEDQLGAGWEVDAPVIEVEELGFKLDNVIIENEAGDLSSTITESSALESEIEGWGMSMPSVIGAQTSDTIFPPVIDVNQANQVNISSFDEEIIVDYDTDGSEIENVVESAIEQIAQDQVIFENTDEITNALPDPDLIDMNFPDEDDLSYPDTAAIDHSGSVMRPDSNLIPLDELSPEFEPADEALEKTDPQMSIPVTGHEMAKEIHDDSSPEEFWAVDENNLVPPQRLDDDATQEFKIEDFVSGAGAIADVENFKRQEESFLKAQKSKNEEEIFEIEVDNEVIIQKIKESLMPQIEEMIREICKETVEKVAWEVIPDLAENLITKEIKNITDSISE